LVVQVPALTTVADSIYQSAGGKDQNGLPLASYEQPQLPQLPVQIETQPESIPTEEQQVEQNTSPGFPANPQQPSMAMPGMPKAMMPASPEVGGLKGIETMRQDSLKQGVLQ